MTSKIDDKIDEFLNVLANDVQQLQRNVSWLDELRSLVIKRDDVTLQKLLETIQSQASSYKDNELKRQSLREELAILFDCDSGKMTLSMLEVELSGVKKTQVTEMKAKLQVLVKELKEEQLKTTMLLSDCSRFNSLLLKNVLELGSAKGMTYSPSGFAEQNVDTGFVNMQF
jgi:hypothetical protein